MTHTNIGCRLEESQGLSDPIPDHMMPIQFAEFLCRSGQRTPEQRLMAAVLEDAVGTFCQYAGTDKARGQRLFCEATEWFESSDASWPLAFESVCDALELDPEWIRALLRRWRATHAQPAASARKIPAIRRIAGQRHKVTAPRLARKRGEQLAS